MTRGLLIWSAVLWTAGSIAAQERRDPVTFSLGSSPISIGPGAISWGGNWGTITAAPGSGSAGVNPGWTQFTYGGGGFTVNSTSTSFSQQRFYSATSADLGGTLGTGTPDGFTDSNPYSWSVLRTTTGSPARLYVRATDEVAVNQTSPTTYLSLDNESELATYNMRLNEIMKFDGSEFMKNTGLNGNFTFSFADFSNGSYRGIDLVFTPVPEPASVLAVGASVLAGVSFVRRRLSRRRSSAMEDCSRG